MKGLVLWKKIALIRAECYFAVDHRLVKQLIQMIRRNTIGCSLILNNLRNKQMAVADQSQIK